MITIGARPPATSTAPITRSASAMQRSTVPRFDASVVMRPLWIWSTKRSRSRFLSSRLTSASMPAAIHAEFHPTFPAPMTTTRAGCTPGAPPSSTPRPPCGASRKRAPACTARRPATSLIGREEREGAVGAHDGLVGDAGGAGVAQRLRRPSGRPPGAGR